MQLNKHLSKPVSTKTEHKTFMKGGFIAAVLQISLRLANSHTPDSIMRILLKPFEAEPITELDGVQQGTFLLCDCPQTFSLFFHALPTCSSCSAADSAASSDWWLIYVSKEMSYPMSPPMLKWPSNGGFASLCLLKFDD